MSSGFSVSSVEDIDNAMPFLFVWRACAEFPVVKWKQRAWYEWMVLELEKEWGFSRKKASKAIKEQLKDFQKESERK